jgi:hypothetical protein
MKYFSKNCPEKKFYSDITIITVTLHEDQYTLLIIYRSPLLRMRIFSDIFVEKVKTFTSYTIKVYHKIVHL